MKVKAYGKINLFLDVISKRDDGYHELEMVMVPIDLFDTLEVNIHPTETFFECDKHYIPLDQRNTVIKAYEIMKQRFDIKEHHQIRLVKNIPAQAGLAGGSADAAAMINVLNQIHDLNLSDEGKNEIALEVGADVPFCILSQSAIVKGIGQIIEPFKRTTDFYLFLIKPSFGISTKSLFEQLVFNYQKSNRLNQCVEGLKTNQYHLVSQSIYNRLQQEAISLYPQIAKIIDELKEFGFDQAAMTGSGSVVFGISQDENLVNRAVLHFVKKYPFVKKTRML